MPLTQATQIVWRMEETRRFLQQWNRNLALNLNDQKRYKESYESAVAVEAEIRQSIEKSKTEFARAVASYQNAGLDWLKVEAVDTESDKRKAVKETPGNA